MKQNRPDYQVGDIVTCSRRRGAHLYKVLEVNKETWTTQQAQYGYCDISDVGKQYVNTVKIRSIFELTVKPAAKPRKVGLTCDTYWCQKVDPKELFEYIQRLNQFLVDTWP